MTVRHVSGTIFLEGDCSVEEAEALLKAALVGPCKDIDWSACGQLHTAVLQVILATRAPVRGSCGNPWLRRWATQIAPRQAE